MAGAGKLDRRLSFYARVEQSDGAGNTAAPFWVFQFEVAAGRAFLKGGESVLAARLESRQPVVLTIRNSTQARQITNDWRAVDTRDGRNYNIRENPKETDDRAYLEFLCESGVAV